MIKNKAIYVSPNGKWGIQAIIPDEHVTMVTVMDRKTLKRHHVSVEHVKTGDKLLIGGLAEKDEDRFIGAESVPAYVKRFILEYIKESV